MFRPRTFDDVKGHDWFVTYFKQHIQDKTLKHFIILDGQEGLGKTSIADLIALYLVYEDPNSKEYQHAYDTVVCKKVSDEHIKKFELSIEGGKDVAKEVRDEMHATFNLGKPKVIICDECHNLSDAAQDVFLSDTEYTDENVYLIMLTTNIERLKPSLRSRALCIHLNTLKLSDMVALLSAEASSRGLNIQNSTVALRMLAEWSECKPRTGLNVLNAFSPDSTVTLNDIRNLIGYLDVKDIIPLMTALSGSLTFGLNYIDELPISSNIVSVVTECLRVKMGDTSYKIKTDDLLYIRTQLADVSVEQMCAFLMGITKHSQLTKVDLVNAFLTAHSNREIVFQPDTRSALNTEQVQIANHAIEVQNVQERAQAPTIDALLMESAVVED